MNVVFDKNDLSGEETEFDDSGERVVNDESGENGSAGLMVGDECFERLTREDFLVNVIAVAIEHRLFSFNGSLIDGTRRNNETSDKR